MEDRQRIDTLISSHSNLWGYTHLDNGVFYTDQLTANEKLLYIAIYSKVNSNHAVAWPSYKTLTEMTGQSRMTVNRGLNKLIKLDLILKTKKSYESNRYTIKTVQESKVLGMDSDLVIEQLEKKMDMPIKDIIGDGSDPGEKEKPKDVDPTPYKQIIEYMNEKTGKNYSHKSEGNKKLIKARWNEGNRLIDFEKVIDVKTSQWKGEHMEQYLRPVTLFGGKFDQYRNESDQPGPTKTDGDIKNRLQGFLSDDQ